MSIEEEIRLAFSHRSCPQEVLKENVARCPEEEDALTFLGLDWTEVTRKHWENHPDAFFSLLPNAFNYYLPSVLSTSLQSPGDWLYPANSLLSTLDREANRSTWDEFFLHRIALLTRKECDSVKKWLVEVESGGAYEEVAFDRAWASVVLIREAGESGLSASEEGGPQ